MLPKRKIGIFAISLIALSLPILAYGQGIDAILNFLFPQNVLTGLTEAWNAVNDWTYDRFGIDLRVVVSWLGSALLFLLDFFVGIIKWIIELVKK